MDIVTHTNTTLLAGNVHHGVLRAYQTEQFSSFCNNILLLLDFLLKIYVFWEDAAKNSASRTGQGLTAGCHNHNNSTNE